MPTPVFPHQNGNTLHLVQTMCACTLVCVSHVRGNSGQSGKFCPKDPRQENLALSEPISVLSPQRSNWGPSEPTDGEQLLDLFKCWTICHIGFIPLSCLLVFMVVTVLLTEGCSDTTGRTAFCFQSVSAQQPVTRSPTAAKPLSDCHQEYQYFNTIRLVRSKNEHTSLFSW